MEDKFYTVDGHPGFVKNPKTGTIWNMNTVELNGARRRKLKNKEIQTEMEDLKDQVKKLTSIIEKIVEK